MLRLTRLTDYGIVLMTRFARAPEVQPRTARELAGEVHLPVPVVSKILKSLARAGLLASHRGVKGGYRLTRRPDEINMAELIDRLEGRLAMTDCTAGTCEHETFCAVRSNWQLINAAVRVALESLTLADMASPLPHGLVTLGRRPARAACKPAPPA